MTDEETPVERGDAQPWLDMLSDAKKEFDKWQSVSDNIDKTYADLEQLRSIARDREFQLFWSNIQIIGPSIYARPPVPVVTPKFKDRRPLYRTASEFLERCVSVSFDIADIDQHMIAMRDDLAIVGRGVPWVRYEDGEDGERVCYEHKDRKDFLHDPARKWCEVDWVAVRAWLTREEAVDRFGEAARELPREGRRDEKGRFSSRLNDDKIGVWEIWCKSKKRVVWVVEGHDKTLEEDDPHLKLSGFFPCPRPAYATLQRRSLIPVPDMLIYKDQLEEVNSLTRRIHALQDAIKVRGFYQGGGDLGAAVERAILTTDDEQILIAIPALAQLMQGSGDPIIWLPIDMIAQVITGLIELRRQVIDDVYQIIGLSDIMRGATQADETYGAQRLKQQNSSFRVRDKQNELVRVARDMVRIGAEIMAEEFSEETLRDMAQMDLPTDEDIEKQIDEVKTQARKAAEDMREQLVEAHAQGQEIDPQQAQQQLQQQLGQFRAQIDKLSQQVTIDQVMEFLKDEKIRPFVLDIETDSTIYPDEQAEKDSRAEFMGAFANSMSALIPMMSMGPEAISVAGGVFKFALSPYRVGRELEGLIDDFVDQGPEIAKRLQEQEAGQQDEGLAAAQMELAKAEMAKVQSQTEANQANAQLKMQELQLKAAEAQAKAQQDQQKFGLSVEEAKGSIEKTAAETRKVLAEIQLAQQKLGLEANKEHREDIKAAADIQMRGADQAMQAQDRQRQAIEGERAHERAERGEDRADRQQEFTERQTQEMGE